MPFAALDRVVMVRDVAVDSSSIDGGGANADDFAPAALNGDGHENGIGGGSYIKSEEEDGFGENAEMPSIKLTEIRDDACSNAVYATRVVQQLIFLNFISCHNPAFPITI